MFQARPYELLLGNAAVWSEQTQSWSWGDLITLSETDYTPETPLREQGNGVLCGPPGAGKTNFLISQLLNYKGSIIVTDLKGDLVKSTYNYRKTLGDVIILDAMNGSGNQFNPLAVIREKQRRTLAITMISGGKSLEDLDNNSRYWITSAAEFWQAAWYAADQAHKPHIPYAVEMIQMGLVEAVRYLYYYHHNNPKCMRHLRTFLGKSVNGKTIKMLEDGEISKNLDSRWGTVTDSATPFYNETFLNIFAGHDIDITRAFKKSTTVYVVVDETDEEGFAAFARLVMKALGDALIYAGQNLGFDQRIPILFLFDEYGNIQLSGVRKWLNTMRSRGIVIWLFVQSLAQLPPERGGRYNPKAENSIHHWMIFASPQGDDEAGERISALSGTRTYRTAGGESSGNSTSHEGHFSQSSNTSVTFKERPNVRTEDVRQWRANEAGVSVRPNGGSALFHRVRAASPYTLGQTFPEPLATYPPGKLYVSPLLPPPPDADDQGDEMPAMPTTAQSERHRHRSRSSAAPTPKPVAVGVYEGDEDQDAEHE